MAMRTRRRTSFGRRPRKKYVIARAHTGTGGLASGGQVFLDVLSDWKNALGIVGNLPGTSVVSVRYGINVAVSAASAAGALDKVFFVGLIVGPDTLDGADALPGTHIHLPWLDWGVYAFNMVASDQRPLTAYGGSGQTNWKGRCYAEVRVRRRLKEINDTLFLSITATTNAGTWAEDHFVSTTLQLP